MQQANVEIIICGVLCKDIIGIKHIVLMKCYFCIPVAVWSSLV